MPKLHMSTMTPANINEHAPQYFDDWQNLKLMQEGIKIGARLQQELKIVKNIHEKESWAGIPKMNPGGFDPHSAYKNYRLDR